ncbi:MAG: hypothetical protein WA655_00225 [Candidatus Korobacteraceae bacterium]
MKSQSEYSRNDGRKGPGVFAPAVPKGALFCLVLLTLLAFAVAPALAQSNLRKIDTLHDTAVDDSGTALPCDGSADTHYLLVSAPPSIYPNGSTFTGGLAYSTTVYPGWVTQYSQTCNGWITAENFGTNQPGSLAAGYYTYETKFEVCCLDPTSLQLSLYMAADNDACVYVNGASQPALCTVTTYGFKQFVGSTNDILYSATTAPFVVGTNRLDFVVHNEGSVTGLNVKVYGYGQRL